MANTKKIISAKHKLILENIPLIHEVLISKEESFKKQRIKDLLDISYPTLKKFWNHPWTVECYEKWKKLVKKGEDTNGALRRVLRKKYDEVNLDNKEILLPKKKVVCNVDKIKVDVEKIISGLYKKACGYTEVYRKVTTRITEEGHTVETEVTTERTYPPDPMSAKMLLQNFSIDWRDEAKATAKLKEDKIKSETENNKIKGQGW